MMVIRGVILLACGALVNAGDPLLWWTGMPLKTIWDLVGPTVSTAVVICSVPAVAFGVVDVMGGLLGWGRGVPGKMWVVRLVALVTLSGMLWVYVGATS